MGRLIFEKFKESETTSAVKGFCFFLEVLVWMEMLQNTAMISAFLDVSHNLPDGFWDHFSLRQTAPPWQTHLLPHWGASQISWPMAVRKHWGQGLRETQPLHDIAWQADTNIAMMYRTIFSGLLSLVLSTVICRRFWFLSLIRHSSPPAGTITGSTWKHDRQNNIIGRWSWVGTPGTPVIERSNVLRCFLMSSKSINVIAILQS